MRLASFTSLSFVLVACSSSNPAPAGSPPDGGNGTETDAGVGRGGAPPLGEVQNGVATYYDADGSGNCSFDPSPRDLDVAAMDDAEYAGSAACGACVDVVGPKGEVTVRIVDRCPECERGHLDLSKQAFAAIADPSAGRVAITWQMVACNVTGNVVYHYKDGSSQYWTAIQVRNHRVPIQKLEWKSGGAYVELPRQEYNYFVAQNGIGPGTVTVRITSIDGQVLTDTLPAPAPNLDAAGAAQFH